MHLCSFQRCVLVWELLLLSATSGELEHTRNAFELDEPSFLRRHELHRHISKADQATGSADEPAASDESDESEDSDANGQADQAESDDTADQADPADPAEADKADESDDDDTEDDKGPTLNSPANPNDCGEKDSPSVDYCKGLAKTMEDNEKCWTCYPSYRNDYCEKLALLEPSPKWVEKCALEESVRGMYCKEFAEKKDPDLKESCFYKDSEYSGLFCLETQKKEDGFTKRCAQDAQRGEEYCKNWADKCAENSDETIYLTCKIFPEFLKLYCQKKAKLPKEQRWDSRCADVKETGCAYCESFVDEETVRDSCAQHKDYLSTFCDQRANSASNFDVELCSTTDTVKESYCHVLAMKKKQTVQCWDVPKFADDFCNQKGFDNDPKCKDNQTPKGRKEETPEEALEENLASQGKLPDNYFSDASRKQRDETIGGTDEEQGGTKKKGLLERLAKRKDKRKEGKKMWDGVASLKARHATIGTETLGADAVDLMQDGSEHMSDPLADPVAGDVEGMDAQLPLGWRSGWDKANARFFFFPVEEDQENGNWRPVDGADEIYERPGKPWPLQDQETSNHVQDPVVMAIEVNKSESQPHSGGRYFPSKKSPQLPSLESKKAKGLMRSEREVEGPAPQSDSEKSFGIKASGALFKEEKRQQTRHTKKKKQRSTPVAEQQGGESEMDAIGQGAAFRAAVLEYQGGFPAKA